MKILAIDPGFERLGIAVLEKENSKEEILYSDCFKTSPKAPFPERLALIGKEVGRVINRFKPKALAIETLLFNTNQKTAMRVAEARGTVIFAAASKKLPIHEYTPLQVKIALTGYGRADKAQIITMVQQLVSFEKKGRVHDDEFDAIAIGLTHFANTPLAQR